MSSGQSRVAPPLTPHQALVEDLSSSIRTWLAEHPGHNLHLYALVDTAQDSTAWRRLAQFSRAQRALLTSAPEEFSPQLLDLGLASEFSASLDNALAGPAAPASFTLLTSPRSLAELQIHLRDFAQVELPGGQEMLLAFWDPAILGTLVGQIDDTTLHVPGPVLLPEQTRALLQPLSAWWYRDREHRWHHIPGLGEASRLESVAPLKLIQPQEDALVEAAVPDQVLYHLEVNQPYLFDAQVVPARRYRFVRAVLPSARKLGLEGMRDLTSFVAMCLIYRQRIETDPQILRLLDQVQQKILPFSEALALMPE